MKQYLQNIIPRIIQHSQSLDKKELFIEQPWVLIDQDKNFQKYIFKRNGELIMSLNGQVTLGKWEYIPAAKSLLIDRISDKILLSQNYVDPIVMVLKKDGVESSNFILANQKLLPELNVEEYIKQLYYTKNKIYPMQLEGGEILEINNQWNRPIGYGIGDKVYSEGMPVKDSVVRHKNLKLIIEKSRIERIVKDFTYKTKKGTIIVEQTAQLVFYKGDKVTMSNEPAPDGKYKVGTFAHIHVKDGMIDKTTWF